MGSIEGEMVAWCTQAGHGTRIVPDGTITGVQFTKAPDYIQVVGFMNQTLINMLPGDAGGEMDPHGADRVCVIFVLSIGNTDHIQLSSVVILWEACSTQMLGLEATSRLSNGTSTAE